ncbi:MAG: F0F1 ATP synthase subunit B [Alphaproteobacteria bacterium]
MEHQEGFFASPEFWVAIAFVLFVAATFRPLKKVIVGALDARAAKIRSEIEEAARLREEANSALAAYQRKQREAVKEAEEIVAFAEREASQIKAKAEEELNAALARREQMALDRIAQAQAHALQEVRNLAVEVAVAATKRLLVQNLDQTRADALTAAAIEELPKKLH